jgi:hypothetical protein
MHPDLSSWGVEVYIFDYTAFNLMLTTENCFE